ncbi:MAG: ATP-binding protein, partial [Bacteroidota bacterium]
DFGFLWMSSDNGIMQLEKKTHKVKVYLPSDGISHREFNRVSHHMAKDGTLYFGGLNGITYFHPKDFVDRINMQPDIPLLLTECALYSEEKQQQENRISEFLQDQKITLYPGDRHLQLQFALLDYGNSDNIQYVSYLNEEAWQIGKDKGISINALPYGQHQLRIMGRSSNGLFSTQELLIPIHVLQPFYWQWWFITLCILSLLLLVFLFQKVKTQALIRRQAELEQNVAERTKTIQAQAEELRQLDRTKSRFLANISHEFRTPLTLILHTLGQETYQVNSLPQAQTHQQSFTPTEIQIMQRNAHRLHQLIDQLLDLSKLEAGKMTLQAERADFAQYLQALVASFQPLAQQKQLELSYSTALATCPLHFDRDKIDKIIYNLLSNAIKFTPEGGQVKIRLFRDEVNAIVEVKDTGMGIPKADQQRIFDRFYQVNDYQDYRYEGTGLGLALVKELVEIHHGRVELQSTTGQGACFFIYLPMGEAHLKEAEKRPTNGRHETIPPPIHKLPQGSKPSEQAEAPILLIIEDNEDLLYHHQSVFGKSYQLLLAKEGQSGIQMAFSRIPDLIICDVMMPDKNGYEICQELKKDERTNHIPIILLTAKASQEDKIEGLLTGADDYLTKPYQQRELTIRMHNLLAQRKRLQEKLQHYSGKDKAKDRNQRPQEIFLDKCLTILDANLNNRHFGVEEWSRAIGMSRIQLFRKIKSINGHNPTQMIRSYRLEKARKLLLESDHNASEVAYMVGFSSPNYFYKCFKDEFGITVKQFLQTAP